MKFSSSILVSFALLHTSCMTTASNEALPALIDKVDESTNIQLQQAASELLFGRPVRLTNTAFLQTNSVLIDRVATVDERGLLIEGRDLNNTAIELTLWLEKGKCYLRRSDNNTFVLLEGILCQAR